MDEYKQKVNRILEDLNIDYVPLNDIVREFSGYYIHPNEVDYSNAIEFLKYLFKNYNLKFLRGPNMEELDNPNEILDIIKEKWEDFDELNYQYWISK